ncbi:MAG: hypothetical protein ABIO70_27735 [Pseudomonadota bacterium]
MSLPLLLACAFVHPVHAGDLWLTVDTTGGLDRVHLEVPAQWLAEAEEPVEVTVEGRTVDLRDVARVTRARREGRGTTLHATGSDGQPYDLVVEHRRAAHLASRAPATLTFRLQGDEGEGLTLRAPLESGTGVFTLAGQGFSADLKIDDLDIPWEAESFLGQLRAAPPTVLLEVSGQDGGRVIVATE